MHLELNQREHCVLMDALTCYLNELTHKNRIEFNPPVQESINQSIKKLQNETEALFRKILAVWEET